MAALPSLQPSFQRVPLEDRSWISPEEQLARLGGSIQPKLEESKEPSIGSESIAPNPNDSRLSIWYTSLKKIGRLPKAVPPLPDDILSILSQPCPNGISSGKEKNGESRPLKDRSTLFLIPKELNGIREFFDAVKEYRISQEKPLIENILSSRKGDFFADLLSLIYKNIGRFSSNPQEWERTEVLQEFFDSVKKRHLSEEQSLIQKTLPSGGGDPLVDRSALSREESEKLASLKPFLHNVQEDRISKGKLLIDQILFSRNPDPIASLSKAIRDRFGTLPSSREESEKIEPLEQLASLKIRVFFPPAWEIYQNQSIDSSRWILHTNELIENSENNLYGDLQKKVDQLPLCRSKKWDIPFLYETVASLFLNRIGTGQSLFPLNSKGRSFSYVQEKIKRRREEQERDEQLIVGGFSPSGLMVYTEANPTPQVGIGAVLRFE